MEEVKKESIPLPDVEADPIGAENIRSGSELSDPLPSRMTREYSEFLHRFDDSDPFERSSFGRPLFDGTDTDSSHGESENSSSFDLPVEVIPAAEELEAAVELSGFDTYTDLNLQEKQFCGRYSVFTASPLRNHSILTSHCFCVRDPFAFFFFAQIRYTQITNRAPADMMQPSLSPGV